MAEARELVNAFKQSYSELLAHFESVQVIFNHHMEQIEIEFNNLESILEDINFKISPTQQVNNMLDKMHEFLTKEQETNDGAGCSQNV